MAPLTLRRIHMKYIVFVECHAKLDRDTKACMTVVAPNVGELVVDGPLQGKYFRP